MPKRKRPMRLHGDRLREMREKRGLTQDELAELVHIAKRTLRRYETNKTEPDADILARFTVALQASADYLLGRVDEPTEHLPEVDPETLALAIRIMKFPEHTRNALIGIIESMEKGG